MNKRCVRAFGLVPEAEEEAEEDVNYEAWHQGKATEVSFERKDARRSWLLRTRLSGHFPFTHLRFLFPLHFLLSLLLGPATVAKKR
jgi:hypothetical protein